MAEFVPQPLANRFQSKEPRACFGEHLQHQRIAALRLTIRRAWMQGRSAFAWISPSRRHRASERQDCPDQVGGPHGRCGGAALAAARWGLSLVERE